MKPTSTIDARILQCIDPRYLHLIIFPTEECSFRCTYCYEDFSIGIMKPDVVDVLKKFISSRTENIESLEISWFGGEPLLAKNVVIDIQEFINSLPREMTISSNMTTNGFSLTRETARKLIKLNVKTFQITLDGKESDHNKTRIGKNGFPTFKKIWHNLIDLKTIDDDFLVILRVHVHPQNIYSVEGLVDDICREFGHDERYKIYIKGVNKLGGINDSELSVYNYLEQERVVQELESKVIKKSILYKPNNNYVCYASRLNSFAIRADGRVAKCTVALNDNSNNVGYLKEDGRIHIDNEKIKVWVRGIESGDSQELQCPYHAKK
ncbi:radical SAM protein [Vibrio parahaemolyticus]|uniref:radical SAM protein n=1 Tax=Vibrio campbellii TaxID=680 RepID=UPI000694E1ED|nr:radical SAM protein [Vibrio campbellii]EHV9721001.1 radical SAM protein [Vibrio parahaemolyticus]EJG0949487.1 radical SAM protein [Vibrio parahaemolyticus O1:K58]EKO7416921.1 radical SAM protein [Vibrio parahaemolyticus]